MISPEFRKVMGIRELNSDGFTYCSGKYKIRKSKIRHKNAINRGKRSDKRKIKRLENQRLFFDLINFYDQ